MSMNPKDELTELEGVALDGTGSDEAEALSTIFRPTEPKICIATHHRETENAVRALLEMEGWRVKAFASIEDMISAVTRDTPNVVFLDPGLPHEGVLSVPELLHTKNPQASIRVVALLFDANSYAINEVMKDGFDDFAFSEPLFDNAALGKVRLFLGDSAGFPDDPALEMVGTESNQLFGSAVCQYRHSLTLLHDRIQPSGGYLQSRVVCDSVESCALQICNGEHYEGSLNNPEFYSVCRSATIRIKTISQGHFFD